MKISRLMEIIIILLQKDKVTAPELAQRFEVSKRTINRDIDSICEAGIPIITTQGFGGGISIDKNYKIDKSLFSKEELQIIVASLKGLDSVSLFSNNLQKILEKFSNRKINFVEDDVIRIDLSSHYKDSLAIKIDLIKKCILEKSHISFTYYYEKGEDERVIEPYKLIFKWNSWYVFGYCTKREDFRLFKLNRLWNLHNIYEKYNKREIISKNLDFDRYFDNSIYHLKAIFSTSQKFKLIESYSIDCFSVIENDKILFERDFVNYENMKSWVLSFADKVKVIEPDILREDIFQVAKNILKNK